MNIQRDFIGSMPPRIEALPRDARGFPVPKFVHWIDGEPDFRVVIPEYMADCVRHKRCWICGGELGAHKAFVVGPMCCVNRISAEPPSHYDCALFAALNCPFLSHPLAKRPSLDDLKEKGFEVKKPGGMMIERNPGVTAVWVTKKYGAVRTGSGVVFSMGDPERVQFYGKGRLATRDEIDHSVKTGLPILEAAATESGTGAVRELQYRIKQFGDLMERFSP